MVMTSKILLGWAERGNHVPGDYNVQVQNKGSQRRESGGSIEKLRDVCMRIDD